MSDVRFYVGAAGAFGAFGIHTTTLLGSVDVTTLIVEEAEDPAQDYGHSDLFLADGAEVLVWQPILDWVRAHQAPWCSLLEAWRGPAKGSFPRPWPFTAYPATRQIYKGPDDPTIVWRGAISTAHVPCLGRRGVGTVTPGVAVNQEPDH